MGITAIRYESERGDGATGDDNDAIDLADSWISSANEHDNYRDRAAGSVNYRKHPCLYY